MTERSTTLVDSYRGKGERRLALAVLADAVDVLRKGRAYNPAAWDETAAWVLDRRPSSNPFMFENICTILGISGGWIRRRLATTIEEGNAA